MSDIIDLDALMPRAVTIKFQNKEININPPKTGDILRLGKTAQKLQDSSESTDIDKDIQDVSDHIYKIIPELNGEQLTTGQLLLLIKIISDMAIPPDAKELQERGITVDGSKKAI